MSKFVPKRDDGLMAYVVTTSSLGQSYDRIEWATSLADAKQQFGWPPRMVTVRRATPADLDGAA